MPKLGNATLYTNLCWWDCSADHRRGLVYEFCLPWRCEVCTPSRAVDRPNKLTNKGWCINLRSPKVCRTRLTVPLHQRTLRETSPWPVLRRPPRRLSIPCSWFHDLRMAGLGSMVFCGVLSSAIKGSCKVEDLMPTPRASTSRPDEERCFDTRPGAQGCLCKTDPHPWDLARSRGG